MEVDNRYEKRDRLLVGVDGYAGHEIGLRANIRIILNHMVVMRQRKQPLECSKG